MKYLEIIAEQIVEDYNNKYDTKHCITFISSVDGNIKYSIDSEHLQLKAYVCLPVGDNMIGYSNLNALLDSILSTMDNGPSELNAIPASCIDMNNALESLEMAYKRSNNEQQ